MGNRECDQQRTAAISGLVVLFTGLSGSGKTTIATAVQAKLVSRGIAAELLDADVIRLAVHSDLGYSRADREENLRRLGLMAHTRARQGIVVLVAAIAPFRESRMEMRRACGSFTEVFVDAPLPVCEQRDPKGLYQKARSGSLHDFTGIDSPYEEPLNPDVHCQTAVENPAESTTKALREILFCISKQATMRAGLPGHLRD